jgi:hypothetical protein
MASLPAHVAPNELIESAWGNLVVDRLVAHRTHTVLAHAFGAGNGTVAGSGAGPKFLPEGTWFCALFADVAMTAGFGYLDLHLSNAASPSVPLGSFLVKGRLFEGSTPTPGRAGMYVLQLIVSPPGGVDTYLRGYTFASTINFTSCDLSATSLYLP